MKDVKNKLKVILLNGKNRLACDCGFIYAALNNITLNSNFEMIPHITYCFFSFFRFNKAEVYQELKLLAHTATGSEVQRLW